MTLKYSVAVVAGICLFVTSATAAVFVQAGAGHPHQTSGSAVWADEFTDRIYTITDGRTISIPNAGALAGDAIRVWDTPIPISATNQSWNVIAFGLDFGGGINNRICAFTSTGAFSSCGATVALGSTSTAFVPTNGSAYSQTTLGRFCPSFPPTCLGSELYHVRAF